MPKFQEDASRRVSVPVVLPTGWVERLNRAATERRTTRSELIRDAIRQAGLLEETPSNGRD